MMSASGFLQKIAYGCMLEQQAKTNVANTLAAKEEINSQKIILAALKEAGDSMNLTKIVSAEKFMIQNSLEKYANSPEMMASLNRANVGVIHFEKCMLLLNKPEFYKEANTAFDDKFRDSSGLPKDGARNFFTSHNARLKNLLASNLSDAEKKVLNARRENIGIAEKLYIERQRVVLGMT